MKGFLDEIEAVCRRHGMVLFCYHDEWMVQDFSEDLMQAIREASDETVPRPVPDTPLLCPFCGIEPVVKPTDPEIDGDAWGEVACVNGRCPAQPSVRDGANVADKRGSDVYKQLAIQRWNLRVREEGEGR